MVFFVLLIFDYSILSSDICIYIQVYGMFHVKYTLLKNRMNLSFEILANIILSGVE